MLVSLTIRDVVLIERLSLSFRKGLCALTGETGAGKSILLDALGLALGARAESGLVRHGADQAAVTAEFELSGDHPAFAILKEQGLDADSGDGSAGYQTLVIRRTVNTDGRSRAWVNDQPVGVGLLKTLGAELVEVHGQFDTHGLLNPQTHRSVLDAYAGLSAQAAQVAAAHRAWRQVEDARHSAAADIARARSEEEYLRHAVAELDALAPKAGEEEELSETRAVLMHREKLVDGMNAAYAELSGDRGVERALSSAIRTLSRIAERAGGTLDPVIAALDRAATEAGEAIAALQAVSSGVDMDPRALEKLEERLFALRAAARKHGVGVDALAALREEMAGRLLLIEDQGDLLAKLAKEAEQARTAFHKAAEMLGAARREAAGRLDVAVAAELAPLKMEKAKFRTLVEPVDESEWSASGIDRVAFQVATNPGSPPGALNKIASGGELARFMLALKVVLAQTSTVGTLVFDEVDTGIGGAVAAAVGERLETLGHGLQVLVVTHSPQVAARGAVHLKVQKSQKGEQVTTGVAELDGDERREEIARMLSGATVTAEARAAADSLIAGRG
ncbi:DNA repair protein RecN (Recombination protein N) [Azospirillum lipoferum]|uniref:DNA repair protein RecN n=1 Tax=Azospirillum lipoferum TaxID=193 RepID=A0A5A9GVB8_AZOLI|nr:MULTISPECIES: DNA repair protein RecN [Azospirillum]KAA0598431.1 DNA repair protein RecN [Azospirillum lipoferum]MCP1609574.1 DNA repair protein RecN (Recombination protein N) [Azospirillum lipoferum]MDW5535117.1 DNA repair protein RecN [Azospirillum sp. NL1]